MNPQAKPNFFIIGAAKCGTTSCYAYLRQHPEIYMSPTKELHYFSHTADYPGIPPGKLQQAMYKVVTERDEFLSEFRDSESYPIRGEASTSYLYIPETADRLLQFDPEAKFLALLRNPADRAFSHYWHSVRHGLETRSVEEALNVNLPEVECINCHYFSRGRYHDQLQRYYTRFRPDQIKVILFESFTSDPATHLEKICTWLDVDSHFPFNTQKTWNENLIPINKGTPLVKKTFMSLPAWGRQIIPRPLKDLVKARLHKPRPRLSAAMKEEIIEFYREDIQRTQALTGLDLSIWLK